MRKFLWAGFIYFLTIAILPSLALSEENVTEQLKVMKEQMAELQNKINNLEVKASNSKSSTPGAISKWIPEIGVVADTVFTSTSTKEDAEGANRLSLRELEVVLGSHVDPYSRLDAVISFSDTEDPSLEEAYLTRFGLPFKTTARIGKFKPKVGKVFALHRDSLDTVDEPLVIQKYFGVEGMAKSGVDVTKSLDLAIPVTQQIVLGVLEGGNGEEGTAFGDTRKRPTIYSHLKNYLDLGEQTGLEIGFSHIIGSRDEDASFEVQVLAADATLIQNFGANQTFKIQGEAFNLNRKESFLDVEEDDGLGGTVTVRRPVDGNLWGSYVLTDFKFHPQWSAGFRYDNVQLVNDELNNVNKADKGYTGYLTFYQSEFARWRTQVTHKTLATGKDDNTVYLQGTFAIGEHKHKIH